MKVTSKLRTLLALIVSIVPSVRIAAQAVPAQPSSVEDPAKPNPTKVETDHTSGDADVIVLSPFEITGHADVGYAATTSLAGNRLNTELRDVGSAISVVNSQFLKDIGATSSTSLLQYTTNTEVGGIYGNFANAGSGTQLNETANFLSPNSNTRVRGLAAADNTTDYFLTDIPWNSYNVDRVDFQRGPNAILFGLGSPAGIINAGTKIATFRNKGQASVKFDQFGGTRTTLDVNQVLLENQLAVRINGLLEDQKFQQKPAFQNDHRIYGALRYEPSILNKGTAHTTIKANFEGGRVKSNQPRTLTPGDAITPWYLTGTATGYDANGVPFTYNNLNKIGFSAIGLQDTNIASIGAANAGQFVKAYNNTGGFTTGTLNPYWQPWLGGQFGSGYFGNPLAIFDSGANSAVRYFNAEPTTTRGIGTNGAIDQSIGGIPGSRMSSITIYRDVSKKVNLPGAKFGLTRNLTLSDPSIFNFYDNLIDGPNKSEWQNFHRFNVTVSQTFLRGDAGFEAVLDKQHYDNGQLVFMTDKEQNIFIDVIQTEADGTANPNFGRPFITGGTGNNNSLSTERESERVTAYLKHDFADDHRGSLLGKILGQQSLTGLYTNDIRTTDSRSWMRYGTDLSYKDFIQAPSTVTAIDNNLRAIYPVIYLGGSLASKNSATNANIPRPTAVAVAKSGSIRVFDSTWNATSVNPADPWNNPLYPVGDSLRISTQSENPANYKGWTDIPFNVIDSENGNRDALTKSAQLTKSKTESQAIVWQGYFWDHAIVGMYGYRTDTAKAWAKQGDRNSLDQVNLDPSSYFLPYTHSRIKASSNSWSIVAHLDDLFMKRLPLDISLSYNQSKNFQPLAGRVGPLKNTLAAPTGDTKDIGITLATKDGKYSLKVNHYESKVLQATSTAGLNPFYLGQLFTDYQVAHNIFKYQLGGTTPDTAGQGDPSRWTYQPAAGQSTADAAAQQATDLASWESLVGSIPSTFFSAWNIDINTVKSLTFAQPIGLAVPENNVSKGYEFEFYGEPIKNLRLTFNASRGESVRTDVGDAALISLITRINTALNTTAAGELRNGSSATATTALQNWNANFYASWLSIKGQENSAVPELRKWRFNLVGNYDFDRGIMKGFNAGAGYRWQDKVIIGYKPTYDNANPTIATVARFDLNQPYYGPSESNVDLWVGYTHSLTRKISWNVQLNVTNVFKHDSLIPVTVQPDGTPAAYRIAPNQVWSVTNTVSF